MSPPYANVRWPVVTSTMLLWALAAASIVFWALRLSAPADGLAPPPVSAKSAVEVDPAAVALLLGAPVARPVVASTPDAASRFVLHGVVADTDQQGAALIAVDGKPARPFRVGSTIVDGYVLQSVGTRSAAMGASVGSSTAFSLQLPTRPLAANPPPNLDFGGVIIPSAPAR